MAVGSGSISNLTVGSGFISPKEINGSATLLKSTQYQTLLFLPETSLYNQYCGEPAISLHSHHVSLVKWTTHLLPVTRDPGSNPLGGTYVKPGFSC
jgi:hypothetical protein